MFAHQTYKPCQSVKFHSSCVYSSSCLRDLSSRFISTFFWCEIHLYFPPDHRLSDNRNETFTQLLIFENILGKFKILLFNFLKQV